MQVRWLLATLLMVFALAPAAAIDWQTDDTLADAQTLIAREDWPAAVRMLKAIVANAPQDPDAINLLAYALRKSGDRHNAEGFYRKALSIDPRHLGANAYLGALYAETARLDAASEQLAIIETICGTTCAPAVELRQAISAAVP